MDRSAGTPRSQTLSRSYKARLPYPLGVYWARVANATTPHDAMLAAEGIVRVLAAPLLADVVHGRWTPELEQLLRVGHGEKPKLKDPAFGTRLAFLRALVASHAQLTESLLGDVQGWWRDVGARAGVLDTVVANRNDVFHGRVLLPPHEQASLLSEVRGHVAGLLKGASFLYNIQWVHADGPSEDDWNQRRGGIRRRAIG